MSGHHGGHHGATPGVGGILLTLVLLPVTIALCLLVGILDGLFGKD